MTVQISAHISEELKAQLERHVSQTGVTRAHLIEQALRFHLQALDALPQDALVPARVVLDGPSAELVSARLVDPPPPTESMRRLFDDR